MIKIVILIKNFYKNFCINEKTKEKKRKKEMIKIIHT